VSAFARILRLTVTNFRSYRAAQLVCGEPLIVLTGPNGAGKTNLLEAISFLTPGRGLRRATLDEVAARDRDGSWAVAAQVDGALGLTTLGTGIEPAAGELRAGERKCRIDGEPAGSAAAFAAHLAVVWLVPAMDSLFAGPAAERRRFVDRLALAIDPTHGSRVNALDRSLRSRNRLLEAFVPDPHWLDAVEHETAELAVAVAAARRETVQRLGDAIMARPRDATPFPSARIRLTGWMEAELAVEPAGAIEDHYRAVLRANRGRDAAAGRTLEGPHLSDLTVMHADKDMPAAQASTGEQKALLIGLVLAHAELVASLSGTAPVLLLDEVVAHLDPARRRALYDRIEALGAQVWMTGADPAAFADLAGRAPVFEVAPGQVTRQSSVQVI
jgi:DNA replication and repair protein RecF